MIEKTSKVTNGKVLNYTVTKDGYKPVSGSKLITANTNININLVIAASTKDAYQLGDRIGGCATFVCYFDSVNPDNQTNKRYAVFVLDAAYRTTGMNNVDITMPALPFYQTTNSINAKESATYNTDYAINTVSSNFYNLARQTIKVNINDIFYNVQLPNTYELKQIYENRSFLDTCDETIFNYPKNTLTTWNINGNSNNTIVTSNVADDYGLIIINNSGTITRYWNYNAARYGVVPIIEIPI